MENYRYVCGVIFIILSSIFYDSFGNEVQTNFQKFKGMQRALLAEILEQHLLDEKLTDAERNYAELVEAVKRIEGKPEFRLPDVETRFEKKVDVIVRESEEPMSKVENVTRCEDKKTAENNQSHLASNSLNDLSDLSCHVKDHCNNNRFRATPCFVIISRADWGTRCTRGASYMHMPVGIVFIHHSAMSRCYSSQTCMLDVEKIQNLHMDINGWDDIGYSFVVGEDGNAYERRGWDRVGAHTRGWNDVSISIAVMGNFNYVHPSEPALQAINSVISCGIRLGKVAPDYKLFGHRDASPSFESPGHILYSLMQKWSHCKNILS